MFPIRPQLPALLVKPKLDEVKRQALDESRAALWTAPLSDVHTHLANARPPQRPAPRTKQPHPLDAKAAKMFEELKKEAPGYMPLPNSFGLPPKTLRRFQDLNLVFGTFLAAAARIGGDTRINANEIGPKTLAMQAPIDSSAQYMAAFIAVAIEKGVGLIVDLTSKQEQAHRKIEYSKGGDYISQGGVKTSIKAGTEDSSVIVKGATQKTMTLRAELPGKPMVGELTHWNVPLEDQRGTEAQALLALAGRLCDWRLDNPGKSVMVHCNAGIGRTGMLVTAERLLNLHDQGRLEPAHADDLVKDEIRFVRTQRSDVMVQIPAQNRTLLECAQLLLERPSSAGATRPVPVNYPELVLRSGRPAVPLAQDPRPDFRASVLDEQADEVPAPSHQARASVFAKGRRDSSDEDVPPQLQRQGGVRRRDNAKENSPYANFDPKAKPV